MVENQATRQIVKEKAQLITFLDAKRLNIISIALSGIKLPHSRIKVLPTLDQNHYVAQHLGITLIMSSC